MKKEKPIKPGPKWLLPAIITGFVFLIYANSIKNKYSLDDDIVTSTFENQNKRIEKGITGIPKLFTSRYVQSQQQNFAYRPLVLTTFALEYQFFGTNPHIGHLINILLYALICLLLFSILSVLLASYNPLIPVLATLIFAAHPLHTEVVDSLKNRDELMSFFFGLLSLRFALKFSDTRNLASLAASGLFILLAFLSKKTSVIFLPAIPLTVFYFKNIKPSKILIPVLVIVVAFIFFMIIKKGFLHDNIPVKRVFVFTENPLYYEKNFFNFKIPFGLCILWNYLKLMLLPFPLSCYYGYNTIPMAHWSDLVVYFSLAIHLSLLFLAIKLFHKKRVLSFGIMLYLVSIAPYSNIFKPAVGILAERFAFAASLGYSIAVAALLVSVFKIPVSIKGPGTKFPAFFWIAAGTILLAFSGITISRNQDWKDRMTLWSRDVKKMDNSQNLHLLIAKLKEKQMQALPNGPAKNKLVGEIVAHYQRIVEIVQPALIQFPTDYMSRNNLGAIYLEYLNKPELAQPLLVEAISLKPDYIEATYNLGFSFEKQNKPDSAIKYYEKTLLLDGNNFNAHSRIFPQLLKTGNSRKAVDFGHKSIHSFPANAAFFINLGNAYIIEKDTLAAIKYFEQAIEIEPSNFNLKSQIIHFLKTSGYPEKARILEEKNR